MVARAIHMLHVEDDAFQQQAIALYLRKIPDLKFDITCVASEASAVEAFGKSPHDLVVLDYHLSQGNGLSCLRLLRQQDPIVPIIAISGTASNAIAAELLQSGADDYFSKQDLSVATLTQSVRLALARTEAYRRRQPQGKVDQGLEAPLYDLCKLVLEQLGPGYRQRLDHVTDAVHEAGLTEQQLSAAFESVCRKLGQEAPFTVAELKLFLQPMQLALWLRL